MFSAKSPTGVYSKAVKRLLEEPQVTDALGEPVKAHGEQTRRGRARHTTHIKFIQGGVTHMRMQFYLKGSRDRATVNLEVKESETGSYEYVYLLVTLASSNRAIVVVEAR